MVDPSIPQVSAVTRLAGLARLLARQAARDLQRLAGAGLELGDLDGQVTTLHSPISRAPRSSADPTPEQLPDAPTAVA
jgi:hypothetical protein